MPRLERVEPRDGMHRGILHEIARVEMAAGRSRQAPMRPALEGWKAALKDRFDGGLIAASRAYDQLDCRLIADQGDIFTIVVRHWLRSFHLSWLVAS